MYIDTLPAIVRSEMEFGLLRPWTQYAPVKDGYLTSAFTSGLISYVEGVSAIEPIDEGIIVRYKALAPVIGIWAMYDRPPKPTSSPISVFEWRDDRPGEMLLYDANGEPITNPLNREEIGNVTISVIAKIFGKAESVVNQRIAEERDGNPV